MDRFTSELRAIQPESSIGPAFVGSSNSLQFIKADVPAFSTWTGGALGRAPAPLTDLKLVQYRLASIDGTNISGLIRSEDPMVMRNPSSVAESNTNQFSPLAPPPLVEAVRYLQFRYWSGTNWLDSWTASGTPDGVEISLAAEPLTNAPAAGEYPEEIFRRIVSLGRNVVAAQVRGATSAGSPEDLP
jgi:hypothetical protein